jgi:protein-tyrosine-phosphatase
MPSSVHPYAIRVLAGMGIEVSKQRAKHVDEFQGQPFDYIITVCDRARENCPVFSGDAKRIHWSFSDPVAVAGDEAQYQAFEQTARQLMIRIRYLLTQINREKEETQ